jgi:hypothetical protein
MNNAAQRTSFREMRQAWAIQFFAPTLKALEAAFRRIEVRVPPPTRKVWKNGFVFRYAEQTIHQAIVQKLARTISGLHAVDLLLGRGFFQEQGMIQRALDELGEDIVFLSLAVINGDLTPRHIQYLNISTQRNLVIHLTLCALTRAGEW